MQSNAADAVHNAPRLILARPSDTSSPILLDFTVHSVRNLLDLPPEIHLQIIDQLGSASSFLVRQVCSHFRRLIKPIDASTTFATRKALRTWVAHPFNYPSRKILIHYFGLQGVEFCTCCGTFKEYAPDRFLSQPWCEACKGENAWYQKHVKPWEAPYAERKRISSLYQ